MVVVKYSQVNEELLNNLVFSKDERNNIKVNYKDGNTTYKDEKLIIQGTTVRVPFGLTRNDNGRLGQTVLSFEARKVRDEKKMQEFNENVEQFRQAMKLIDNKFREEFYKNYENNIRLKEKYKQFDSEFIDLPRSVYNFNDKRSKIKNLINIKFNSNINEVKEYN